MKQEIFDMRKEHRALNGMDAIVDRARVWKLRILHACFPGVVHVWNRNYEGTTAKMRIFCFSIDDVGEHYPKRETLVLQFGRVFGTNMRQQYLVM